MYAAIAEIAVTADTMRVGQMSCFFMWVFTPPEDHFQFPCGIGREDFQDRDDQPP